VNIVVIQAVCVDVSQSTASSIRLLGTQYGRTRFRRYREEYARDLLILFPGFEGSSFNSSNGTNSNEQNGRPNGAGGAVTCNSNNGGNFAGGSSTGIGKLNLPSDS
jgi:hypothetical protein